MRTRGDAALLEFTARFDRWTPRAAARARGAAARRRARRSTRIARGRARGARARRGAHPRLPRAPAPGVVARDARTTARCSGQQVTPLDRVGLYVPGGKAAYPSSVLMNAVAAKVAGVPELVMVTPTPGGELNAAVLAAAALAGVDRIFRIGGAQAVGALAYGTATVPPSTRSSGPGNAYVAAAKRRVFGRVGIDMVAGPSEVLVIADASAQPRLGRDGPLLAGRARRDRAGDPAHARRGPARARGRVDAPRSSPRCRGATSSRPRSPRAARSSACATSTRPARSPTASRPSTWSSRSPIREALLPAHPPRRRDLPRPPRLGVARRLLRRPQPRAADLAHGALLLAARASTTSRSARA